MSLDANVRASLYMSLSMSGFACGDVLVKSLDGRLTVGQVVFVRGLMLGGFVAVVLWRRGLSGRFGEARHPLVFARAFAELAATIVFLLAIVRLPFASVSAILQSLPLAVTLGAVFFGEIPDGWTIAGASVIVATGPFSLYRELVATRRARVTNPSCRRRPACRSARCRGVSIVCGVREISCAPMPRRRIMASVSNR